MGSFGRVRTTFALSGLVVLALSGCSSGKKSTPPTTTTNSSSTSTSVADTSTSVAATTSTTEATTVPTTSAPTTPTTTGQSSVRITGYAISPAAPVCNSPTMIQLTWTATGATTVDLAIDGSKFASYPGGHQSPLEYFACDGKAHTYRLTAHGAGGATAVASKVVRSSATG